MKTITIHIDEEVFSKLKAEASLLTFCEGCVAPPSLMEQIMNSAIIKMANGETEMTILENLTTKEPPS